MLVKVIKTVPGYVNYRCLNAGDELELDTDVAVSLLNDGYVEPVERSTPVERSETATQPRSGRGRAKN